MDSKQPIIEKGFLAIKNKMIMAVGKRTKASSLIKAKETISGAGKLAKERTSFSSTSKNLILPQTLTFTPTSYIRLEEAT